MKRYIAVAAALAVVAIFFYGDELNLPLIDNFELDINTASIDPVGASAWRIFEQYRNYAKIGDLEGIKGISHQISDTCSNPATLAECETLMQSVAIFTENMRGGDFKNVYYDERQIVMLTDPTMTADGGALAQTILFFTRTPAGEPKVLGMRFCFKGVIEENKSCFDSSPETRDKDGNGWWDAVESLFYKQ